MHLWCEFITGQHQFLLVHKLLGKVVAAPRCRNVITLVVDMYWQRLRSSSTQPIRRATAGDAGVEGLFHVF